MPTLAEEKTADITGDRFCDGVCAKIALRFQTNSLPAGAMVTAARLSLVSSGTASANQTVKVHYDTNTNAACTASSTGSSKALLFGAVTGNFGKDSRVNWVANDEVRKKLSSERSPFSLCLKSRSPAKSSWHLASDKSSYRPRLILEYSLPGQPALTQSNGLPAVQSARPFLPTHNGGVSDQFSYVTRSLPKAGSNNPAFYDGQVYLVTGDTDGKKQLRTLNPLGSPVRPPVLLDGTPGQHLLVSKLGRLYIVGSDSIFFHQLDKLDSTKPAQRLSTQHDVSCDPNLKPCEVEISGLNPSVAPSVGPAGSLYFVNGLEVYGLNPDLQELWKVTLDGSASRVTVGPSGRFVYLTTGDDGLVAINAQTGEFVKKDLPNQDPLRVTERPALHAPVVIRHPDGSEKIYAAANSDNGGVLACFTNRNTRQSEGDRRASDTTGPADLEPCYDACKQPVFDQLWGQPIPDQRSPGSVEQKNVEKRIYAVRVVKRQEAGDGVDSEPVDVSLGSPMAIGWLDGSTHDMTPPFKVAGASYLLNGGNLAMDKDGNTFVWNGAGATGLYVFPAALPKPLTLLGDIPVKAQLLFGSDGTLYANDVDGRVLMAIVPQVELSHDFTGSISSTTNLRVVGTASNKTDKTVLKAEGSVLLGPGFTVKRGATLTIGKTSTRND